MNGYFSLSIEAAEAVGAVGIPGGWMVGGISNGCGKVREEGGGVAGAFHIRSASTAGRGEAASTTRLREGDGSRVQTCVRLRASQILRPATPLSTSAPAPSRS